MVAKKSSLLGKAVGGALLAAGLAAVFLIDWQAKPAPAEELVRPLKTVVVGEEAPALRGRYPGKVRATRRVELGFEVPGRISELPVLKGQVVKKGQLLARLDPRDYQSDLNAVQARLEQAKAYRERIRKAAATNAVSKQELDDAEAAAKVAESEIEIKVKALADTKLEAMFDGVIADRYADNYQNVQAKQAILSLQDVTALEIEAGVPEQRIAGGRSGAGKTPPYRYVARFDYFPGQEFEVLFKECSTEANPVTQTYTATFILTVPPGVRILPGMTATLLEYHQPGEGAGAAAKVLMVPLDMVPRAANGDYFVWLVGPPQDGVSVVRRQPVKVGEMSGGEVEIVSGLAKGARIAAAGVTLLRDGQKVRAITPVQGE